MALFGKKKTVNIHEHSSEAEVKGLNGSFIADLDLDEVYNTDGRGRRTINADIFTSVMEIVPKIARMKVVLNKGDEEVKNNLTYILNEKPNHWESAYQFKFNIIKESIIFGNSYVEIVRDKEGEVKFLRRLKNENVHMGVIYADGDKSYVEDIFYVLGVSEVDDNARRIAKEDILHLKPFNFEGLGLEGISIIDLLTKEIEIGEGVSKLYQNYLKMGGLVGGQIKVDGNEALTPQDRELLKSNWVKALSNYNPLYVTDTYSEYIPNNQNADVVNALINNKSSASKFAQVFKLPLHKMGVSTSNMSLNELNQDFLNNTLAIYIEMFASEVNDKFYRVFGEYEHEFKFDSQVKISAMDFESRKSLVDMGIRNGFLSGNESREILGLSTVGDESLDTYRFSLNSVNSEIADEYQLGGKEDSVERGDEDGS